MHKYTVYFYHIVIVYVRNYHNMLKKYCLEALHEKKKFKPCMRSLISCMRYSVYVHHYGLISFSDVLLPSSLDFLDVGGDCPADGRLDNSSKALVAYKTTEASGDWDDSSNCSNASSDSYHWLKCGKCAKG